MGHVRVLVTILFLLGAVAASVAAPKSAAPPLDNAGVVKLWSMGLGERYVIAKIAKADAVDRTVTDVLGFTMVYSDHPAAQAAVRTTERRPTLTVEAATNPAATMWLVKCDPDRGANKRSVKIGGVRVVRARGAVRFRSRQVTGGIPR